MMYAVVPPELLFRVRGWERTSWKAFLGAVHLRPRAVPFLEAVRASGRKIAIVSDLTLEVQLMKLEAFDLFRHLDALIVSEEVPFDKPAEEVFRVAIERLGTDAGACVIVGDNDDKNGEGARRLGAPYIRIDANDVEGEGFDALAHAMGIA